MTEERAKKIVRNVIYENLCMLPNIDDSNAAIQIGRMLGIMQKTLEVELENEITYKESD